MRKSIAIDIDGVIADSLPALLEELNAYFGHNLTADDVTTYDICRVYGINKNQLAQFLADKERLLIGKPAPVSGAKEYAAKLRKLAKVILITARSEKYRQDTESWLKKHGIVYDELIMLGHRGKIQTCREQDAAAIVEDNPDTAREAAEAGIPVVLVDAPYNRNVEHPLIRRAATWPEIYEAVIRALRAL
ncbi:MAG: hypothetical protein H0Z39_08330 [Peptococcaceae bacterium]|nr:hypothetical protein [Peptococcaceae bacterium]